jgi:hypothetical protein
MSKTEEELIDAVANATSPDEAKAAIEKFDAVMQGEAAEETPEAPVAEPEVVEQPPPGAKTPQDGPGEEPPSPPEAPPQEGAPKEDAVHEQVRSMPSGKEIVDVTPEYIEAQPEEVRPYLKGLEGETLSLRVIKDLVNKDWKIQQMKREGKPEPESAPPTLTRTIPVNADINGQIVQRLRTKYQDIPEGASQQDLDEYITDKAASSALAAEEFKDDYRAVKQQVTGDVQKVQYIADNWAPLAKTTIDKAVGRLNAHLEKFKTKASDLGLDLALNQELYNDFLFKKVLFVGGDINRPDPNVITRYARDADRSHDFFVLNEDAVYQRLVDASLPMLAQYVENRTKVGTRQPGRPAPNLAQSGSGNSARMVPRVTGKIAEKAKAIDDLGPNASVEEIQKSLDGLAKAALE